MTRSKKKKKVDTNSPKWSDLPGDLLQAIFKKLKNHSRIYRCGTVCVSWQSVVKTMLPQFVFLSNGSIYKDNNGVLRYRGFLNDLEEFYCQSKKSCVVFNPITNKVHEISLPEDLHGRFFSSSSFGWLLTVGINPSQVYLVNPFRVGTLQIRLPSATQFSSPEELRVITSSSPLDPGCLFLAMDPKMPYTLAFCRRKDESWRVINQFWTTKNVSSRTRSNSDIGTFCDAIFYQGYFYVVNLYGDLYRLHCGRRWPRAEKVRIQRQFYRSLKHYYLVELNGILLLVVRSRWNHQRKRTWRFYVFEWNQVEEKWIKLNDIGNNVIVVGKCSSVVLPGHFKANCIYFIDDDMTACGNPVTCSGLRGHDTGVYDMETHRIHWLYQSSPIYRSCLLVTDGRVQRN